MSAGQSKAVVFYDDGSQQEFNPNRPRLLLDMENRYHVQTPETHQQVFWLAHHAVAPDEDFDLWVDRVAEVKMETDEESSGEG